MSVAVQEADLARDSQLNQCGALAAAWENVGGYLRRNCSMLVGLGLLFVLVLFALIGRLTGNTEEASPLSDRGLTPPLKSCPSATTNRAAISTR